jgi:2,3,4,5-tetrahydropyridine-2-carboxylate N-succinyltransferase
MQDTFNKVANIWDQKTLIQKDIKAQKENLEFIISVIELLNQGKIRAANKKESLWKVEPFVKKAIILYFMLSESHIFNIPEIKFYDKIPLKFSDYDELDFKKTNSRFAPGSFLRNGVYIGKNVIIMPSFINIGAYIDDYTMIDSCVTIGSCAQIGKKCHISSGVTIGGVLEPIGENPVIIEDNCFVGAGSQILEGVIVEENSIIGAGVTLSSSTRIIYRETGKVIYGNVPKNSVLVSGSYGGDNITPSLSCAVIIKNVDEDIKSKLSINEILRH